MLGMTCSMPSLPVLILINACQGKYGSILVSAVMSSAIVFPS